MAVGAEAIWTQEVFDGEADEVRVNSLRLGSLVRDFLLQRFLMADSFSVENRLDAAFS